MTVNRATHDLCLFLSGLVEAAQGVLETDRQGPQGLRVGLPIHDEGIGLGVKLFLVDDGVCW